MFTLQLSLYLISWLLQDLPILQKEPVAASFLVFATFEIWFGNIYIDTVSNMLLLSWKMNKLSSWLPSLAY